MIRFVVAFALLVVAAVPPAVAKAPGPLFMASIAYPRHQPKLTVQLDDRTFLVPLSAPLAQRGWRCVIRPDPPPNPDDRVRHIQCTDRAGIVLGTAFICGEDRAGTLAIGNDDIASTIIMVWCAL